MNWKTKLLFLSLILLATSLVYSNHFNNAFHFDDTHTIVDNLYIRDIKNIPLFFKDATTTSTLPLNQAYRPGLTTLNAIDLFLSGKKEPTPFAFHLSIFISYLILGVLCFFLFQHLLNISFKSKYNSAISLFGTAFFLLHTANAETINYIIARSDSFSTLMIVLSFIVYIYFPKSRKWHVYFIPSLLGFFVKEPSIMFVPLLFVYKLLFEQNVSAKEWFTKFPFTFRLFKQIIIPFLICILIFVLSRVFTPVIWQAGGTSSLRYLMTQPFVLFHYCYNFILPSNLVVDTDWQVISSYREDQILAGLLFVFAILLIAFRTSFTNKTRPITFGLLWFFIALIPTSSFVPFAEVMNDHRTFFPYIGLFIAVACFIRNLLEANLFLQKGFGKMATLALGLTILGLNGYGTFQRNKVWATEESLWKDATIKAPKNGRGWMNYGNVFLGKGEMNEALKCYAVTTSITPNYPYAYINIAIAKSRLGDLEAAEQNFKKAISLGGIVPECYIFYGRYLIEQQRIDEAKKILQIGLNLSPKHQQLQDLMNIANNSVNSSQASASVAVNAMLEAIKKSPSAEKYLDLSLYYYKALQYQQCIEAANEALKINPKYDLAYNNICAAYNRLGLWDKAIEAGEKGLKLNPNNQLLKGNLTESYSKRNNL
jgi:tetratricopeptide (TPR) repeat protein